MYMAPNAKRASQVMSITFGVQRTLSDCNDEPSLNFLQLYWFTVEFGLCKQGNQVRVYGAALASSYGEMQRALSMPQLHQPYRIDIITETSRAETNYQPTYFVTESFHEMTDSLR